ncbi:MAG: hypothetical protein ACQXXF_07940 [Thermoplasmatota archaeon]|jgi:hypothetical protein
MTYEYLDKSYNRGIKCVHIVGEKEVLEMASSIRISNLNLLSGLNEIIKNNKELSDKISTLEMMNSDLKFDPPLRYYPIICIILFIIIIPFMIYFFIVDYIFDNINPNIELFWILSMIPFVFWVGLLGVFGCIIY